MFPFPFRAVFREPSYKIKVGFAADFSESDAKPTQNKMEYVKPGLTLVSRGIFSEIAFPEDAVLVKDGSHGPVEVGGVFSGRV